MSARRISQAFALPLAATAFSALIADETAKPTDAARPQRAAGKKVAKAQVPPLRTLYGLDWHGSLASAQQAATSQEGQPGKPDRKRFLHLFSSDDALRGRTGPAWQIISITIVWATFTQRRRSRPLSKAACGSLNCWPSQLTGGISCGDNWYARGVAWRFASSLSLRLW